MPHTVVAVEGNCIHTHSGKVSYVFLRILNAVRGNVHREVYMLSDTAKTYNRADCHVNTLNSGYICTCNSGMTALGIKENTHSLKSEIYCEKNLVLCFTRQPDSTAVTLDGI